MKYTIKDVARHANVSIATVSRVVNGAPSVKKQLKEKVEQSIRELNFTPNQLARGLKCNETKTIGVIIPDMSNPFFMKIISEIEKVIGEKGYVVLIVSTRDWEQKELDSINLMVNKSVDGIVITSTGQNEEMLAGLAEKGFPVVLMDRRPKRPFFDSVYVDKVKAMKTMNSYLFEKGHKRIALVTGPKELPSNKDRLTGYIESYFEQNLLADKELIKNGTFTEEFGSQAFEEIIGNLKDVTAIVSGSARITDGILKKAKEMRVSIPGELSVISLGDIINSELIEPRLTYFEAMPAQIGRTAGQLLLERINNPDGKVKEVVFDSDLVEGKSVKTIF